MAKYVKPCLCCGEETAVRQSHMDLDPPVHEFVCSDCKEWFSGIIVSYLPLKDLLRKLKVHRSYWSLQGCE